VKILGLLDLPGTGTGLLRARSPQARLLVGGALLLAVAVTPLTLPGGAITIAATVIVSVLASGMPARMVGRTLAVFALLYVPLLALLVVARLFDGGASGSTLAGSAGAAGLIAVRAFALLMVSAAVVSTLPIADLVRGGAALPVPAIVPTLLVHILHQSSLMLRETESIAQAVALRGGAHGVRVGIIMARSIPSVWLPRVEARIERTARAADLRGADRAPEPSPRPPWEPGDAPMILTACCIASLAITLRFLP
jgi:energy-coupling factor transporter transmembrane protein EcfT